MDRNYILHFCYAVMAGVVILAFAQFFFDGKEVDAIIGEAEGEPYIGKLGVACALRARGNLIGVYGHRSARVLGHEYSRQAAIDAELAWAESRDSANCRMMKGAQHWLKADEVSSQYSWVNKCERTITVGRHEFYKCP